VRLIVAQLTDPHVRVGPGDAGSAEALADAVRAVIELEPVPDALLLTGDLTNHASAEEYERVAELIAPLPMPVHLLAGNHDDADAMRTHLGAPGPPGELLQYTADLGGLRLVACDTTIVGRDDGALGAERLAWIDAQLASDTQTPTLLAMHHPPLRMGIPVIDQVGLANEDSAAVAALVARHPQVKRIVSGHVHRAATGTAGGCAVFVCPSSYVQLALDFADDASLTLVREPPGFGLHVAVDGELTSHVQPIGDFGPQFRLG
jgi:3',5'-cyclic-AMP phosphodiesterase